jgi:hypothetical protein
MVERRMHPCVSVTDRPRLARRLARGTALVKNLQGAMLAEAVDISAYGVCLTLPRALNAGAVYVLDLEIHGDQRRTTSTIGRVCFCLEVRDGFRIGFNCSLSEFVDP